MNVFNREWKKLLKLEQALDKYESYNIPTVNQYMDISEAFHAVITWGDWFADVAYYELYLKYGNPNNSEYEERLKMYTYHSKDTKWYFPRYELTENELKTLCVKYHYLKQRVIKCCEERKWRYNN